MRTMRGLEKKGRGATTIRLEQRGESVFREEIKRIVYFIKLSLLTIGLEVMYIILIREYN